MDNIRIDKWLWAVRLYKTRTLAGSMCTAGKVKRNGSSLKPSTIVKINDQLSIPSADGSHKRDIIVRHILDKRVSAPIAIEAYEETTPQEVIAQALEVAKINRSTRVSRKDGDQGRMTKKQRRDWKKGLYSQKEQ